jgi:dimethylargininase
MKKTDTFSKAIVRTPCQNMVQGLTTAGLGIPDYGLALEQHRKYIQALNDCGLDVIILDEDPEFPDSTFVEDTALLTPDMAVISNPGAESRKGEITRIRPVIEELFEKVECIEDPGTLEPGDVMMVGTHFYIGLSDRTNKEGAGQLKAILDRYGMSATIIQVRDMLHLKSGVAFLGNNTLLGVKELVHLDVFRGFDILEVSQNESYAANAVWINGKVLLAKGYPETRQLIKSQGYPVVELDVSEFRKLDGGLSCLSLRF